jgi:predicted transcriptional regulator of viral defense system
MATVLGNLETQFFAYIQMRKLSTIQTGELVRALGLTTKQERELLSRLSRRKLIARLRRGIYLVPPRLPPGGKWNPDEFSAISILMSDRKARYQICGPSAFYRYGWDDQVPNRLYVYNNCISGDRKIGSTAMTLIKISEERLGATEVIQTPDGVKVEYSSRIRSLIDAVYDWNRFQSLPRAYLWIREEINRNPQAAGELVRLAIQYANISTLRRLGKLLEAEGVQDTILRKIEKQIRPSSALIPWIPILPKRGTVNRRWGVIVNGDI